MVVEVGTSLSTSVYARRARDRHGQGRLALAKTTEEERRKSRTNRRLNPAPLKRRPLHPNYRTSPNPRKSA